MSPTADPEDRAVTERETKRDHVGIEIGRFATVLTRWYESGLDGGVRA
jgi:hypothetical protein